jgi:hypothetical protein
MTDAFAVPAMLGARLDDAGGGDDGGGVAGGVAAGGTDCVMGGTLPEAALLPLSPSPQPDNASSVSASAAVGLALTLRVSRSSDELGERGSLAKIWELSPDSTKPLGRTPKTPSFLF